MHTSFIHKIDLSVQLTVVFLCTQEKKKPKKWLQPSRNTFRGIKAIYGWGIRGVKGIVKFGKVPLARNKILEHVKKVKPPLAREGCRCGDRTAVNSENRHQR